MNSIIEIIPQLLSYQLSFLALAVLCLSVLVQNFLTAPLAFLKEQQVPGMPLKGDHTLRSFRVLRTYANSVENLPTFGLTLFIAILIGVGPSLVNGLAVIHVAFRIAFWGVYYGGIGKVAGGPRTLCYVGGLISNIVLVCACIYTFVK
ncbi:MAG: MAPEG family protein [Pseudomonadales bacterium]